MTIFSRFKLFLWYFGLIQVPLIGYLRPKIITLSDDTMVVRIRLSRRSKNHLDSMYFAALAAGADIAGGMHGFYHAKQSRLKVSLAFKSFHAQFLKRAESDVYFVCDKGLVVKNMVIASEKTGQRITNMLPIQAFTHYPNAPELVAQFELELSIKVITAAKT